MSFNKLKALAVTLAPAALMFASQVSADEATAPQPAQVETYVVKSGDTLSQIAEHELGSVQYATELAKANGITNINLIYAGQELKLKGVKEGTAVAPATDAVTPTSTVVESAATTVAPSTDYSSYGTGSVQLSNGNTAGSVGSYAAQEIANRTGTSASTWEYIIAKESNGDVNAYNPSGASGLFQTMPGWGSTATVEDQINSAVNAYNAQGFSAWGV